MKNLSILKTLALSSIALFCATACSPSDDGVNIQSLINKDAEIAFYAKTNPAIIKEIKAIPEHKELFTELKKYNQNLGKKYLEASKEATPAQRKVIDAIISPDDVIGSIESLILDQDLSIAFYIKNSMAIMTGGNPDLLLALKSGNETFPKKILDVLSSISEEIPEVTKSKLDNYDLFCLKSGQNPAVYILNVKDSFLLSSNKETLNTALKEISAPSGSILDSADFKATISDPNSELWIYASDKVATIVSLMTKTPSFVRALGIQAQNQSLERGNLSIKLKLNNNPIYTSLVESYKNFKSSSLAKNIYENSALFASINFPKDLSFIQNDEVPADAKFVVAMFSDIISNINSIDSALAYQDLAKMSKNTPPEALINVYTIDSDVIWARKDTPVKTINNIEYTKINKGIAAKISKSQLSFFLDENNIESNIEILKNDKTNSKISNALNGLSLENCIAELYLDVKYMQKLAETLNKQSYDEIVDDFFPIKDALAKLDAACEESTLISKLALNSDSITLVAQTKMRYNYKLLKEAILLIADKISEDIKEMQK